MDMSDSQTMFEMHQAMSAEWATALADKIDEFAEMGNSGAAMFGQFATQLTTFIDQKKSSSKKILAHLSQQQPLLQRSWGMLRSFGNAPNPPEFEAQGVKDGKDQTDYENAEVSQHRVHVWFSHYRARWSICYL